MAIRAFNTVFQFVCVLVLARLLSPEDYGLTGMALVVTSFAPLVVDFGSRDAISRRERVSPGEVSALFWVTIALGLGLTLLIAVSSPFAAAFYRDGRLTDILLVSSLVFVTMALSCQHQALMRRAMMFRELAQVEVFAGFFSSAIVILMALTGWQYWSLVAKPLLLSLLMNIGVWLHCRWVPTRPTMTSGVWDMVKFGRNLVGSSFTDYARSNIDRLLIGRRYGPATLGLYQNGLQVYSNLQSPLTYLNEIAVVGLAKVLHDKKEYQRLWVKGVSTLAFFAMPAFGLIAVTGRELVVVLLGDRWAAAGAILCIFSFRGILSIVEPPMGWLHLSAGRADRFIKWSLLSAVFHIASVSAGLKSGIEGVAVAMTVATYALFVPGILYAGKPLDVGLSHLVDAIGRQFVGTLLAVAIGMAFRAFGSGSLFETTLLVATAYVVVYLVVVVGFFRLTAPIVLVWTLLRDMLPSGPVAGEAASAK